MEPSDLYLCTVPYAHTQTNEQNYKKCVSFEPQNSRKASKQTKNQVAIPYLLEHLQPRVLKTPSTAKDEGGCWRKSYLLQREYKVTQPCGLMVWQLLTRLDVLVTRSSSGALSVYCKDPMPLSVYCKDPMLLSVYCKDPMPLSVYCKDPMTLSVQCKYPIPVCTAKIPYPQVCTSE